MQWGRGRPLVVGQASQPDVEIETLTYYTSVIIWAGRRRSLHQSGRLAESIKRSADSLSRSADREDDFRARPDPARANRRGEPEHVGVGRGVAQLGKIVERVAPMADHSSRHAVDLADGAVEGRFRRLMHDQLIDRFGRPAAPAQGRECVANGLLNGDRRGFHRVGEHDCPAVRAFRGSGHAQVAMGAQRHQVELEKARIAGRARIEQDRDPGVTESQAGKSWIDEALDLQLRGARQVGDVFTARHQCIADHSGLQKAIGQSNRRKRAGASVGYIECQSIHEPEPFLEPRCRGWLVTELEVRPVAA